MCPAQVKHGLQQQPNTLIYQFKTLLPAGQLIVFSFNQYKTKMPKHNIKKDLI